MTWCPAISAASIIAKTHRDALWRELDGVTRATAWRSISATATARARAALVRLGPCRFIGAASIPAQLAADALR